MPTRFAQVLSIIYSVAFFSAIAALLIWGWARYFKQPRVRGLLPAMSVGGLALVSISVLIGVGGFIRQLFNPGLLYFDPILQRMVGIALLVSLLAVAFSLLGVWSKNPVRWHSLALSLVLFLMWFAAAMDI